MSGRRRRSPTGSFTATSSGKTRNRKRSSSLSSSLEGEEEASKNKSKTNKKKRDGVDDIENPWYYHYTKGDEEYGKYMSTEWGYEKRGDDALFEKLSLEGCQCGLSWLTILRKRDAYRKAFHNFVVDDVAAMTESDVETIMASKKKKALSCSPRDTVVLHRGKIRAIIHNAKCVQEIFRRRGRKGAAPGVQDAGGPFGAFDDFMWSFVDDKPILNRWDGNWKNAPTTSKESDAMSAALKEEFGFKFVGSKTCYALMQSCGMVIDHPASSKEWRDAYERLQSRPGGYQERNE